MERRDARPFFALAAVLALVALGFVIPASRAWLIDVVVDPLRAQADPSPGLRHGYSVESLFVWAAIGAVFAWAAYEIVFVRARFEPDRAFFLALAPALVLGPLLHAALVSGALRAGSVIAYLAAEPVVYLTIALFAGAGLALGRVTGRPVGVPIGWGALGLAAVLWLMLPRIDADGARLALILFGLALAPALALAWAYTRWKPAEPFAAVFAVVAAHALDGATTWMVLRDPFRLGFEGFGERNPVSLTLVTWSNGWPYFALKLALPLVLLAMLGREEHERRIRAFLLFAVFVLGFGPGMANLMQVIFS